MQPRIQLLGGVPATVNTPVTFTQKIFFNGGAQGSYFQVGASQPVLGTNAQDGEIYFNSVTGLTFQAKSGSGNDLAIFAPGGTVGLVYVNHGSQVVNLPGGVAFGGSATLSTYVKDAAWTPVPTGFTIINGTGAVTFAGTYTQLGNLVFWTVTATLTGSATLAATLGTSGFNAGPWGIPQAPAPFLTVDALQVTYTGGFVAAGVGTILSPTMPANGHGGNVYWTGVLTL